MDASNFLKGDSELKISPRCSSYIKKTPINLQWNNITLRSKDDVTLLKDVSGSANSGELTAVMGPSGSGKTSLINVLSGYTQTGVSGEIFVNGVKREMKWFRQVSGYVLQHDYLLPHFTVRELITMASRLKITSTITEKERRRVIDNCLHSLGLTAHADKRASVLSGGQRKRVHIAQEIISNPPLIFLDEPTSGLDSTSCLQCIQLLKSLARDGRNVICTIHQPSSRIYNLFDNLYVVADGQCIYRGLRKNLIPFLSAHGLLCPNYYNPADFIINVALGVYGDNNWKLVHTIDVLKDLKEYSKDICPLSSVKYQTKEFGLNLSSINYATSSSNQFKVLFKRSLLSVFRDPVNLVLKIFGNVICGLILGCMCYNTADDAAYLTTTVTLVTALNSFLLISTQLPTIAAFPLQKKIFKREHLNGWYSEKVYYLAMMASEVLFQMVFPAINFSLVYCLTGQPREFSRFASFLLSGIMAAQVSQSLALLIAVQFSFLNAACISTMLIFLNLVMCGAVLPASMFPALMKWLTYVNYMSYGFKGMVLSLYKDRRPVRCSKSYCRFVDFEAVMKYLDIEGDTCVQILAMAAFFVAFRSLSYKAFCKSLVKDK